MNIVKTFKFPNRALAAAFVAGVMIVCQAAPTFAAVQSPAPAAKVTFTFDDGAASAYTQAMPVLAKYGITGTSYVITGCLGMTTAPNTCHANKDATYMTWAQVQALQAAGWEIGSHTVTHPLLATSDAADGQPNLLTPAQVDQELSQSKAAFAAHGINTTDFASPYGDYNNAVLAAVAKYYASQRGFQDVSNNVWSYNDYIINDMPVQSGVTVAQVKTRIDEAITNNHWLVLTFHDIKVTASTNPSDYEYKTADLDLIAAYVKTKQDAGLIKQVNINKGLVTSDVNLLPNPSFDNGIAGGWTIGGGATISGDGGNNGSYPSPLKSAKIVAGATNGFLFSPKVAVDSTQTYMVKSYLNLQTIAAGGELGYYVDEYDLAGNWISGQWIQAKTAATVMSVNFPYKPTSTAVKKASLQIYTTANSGVTAYIDNVQMFNLADTSTPPPADPTVNLLPNSSYDAGLGGGWHADNAAAFTPDAANHGAPASPVNAIKITAQATTTHLFAPQVAVDAATNYLVNMFLNVSTITTGGEVAVYVDEYDINGAWISGKYAYAKRNAGSETISFAYTPSSANVKKAGLQIILTGNSGITGWLDEVQFLAPTGTTPPPVVVPPVTGPNLVTNGTFDAGLTGGWTTNDAVNITADSTGNGAPTDAAKSVKLVSSTVNRHLFGPQVAVSNTKSYSISTYLKIQAITSGEIGFYIDEYDAAGNWISGQYKTGASAISAGDITLTYTPTSATVAKASLQIIVVGNGGITAYIDNVRWYQN